MEVILLLWTLGALSIHKANKNFVSTREKREMFDTGIHIKAHLEHIVKNLHLL